MTEIDLISKMLGKKPKTVGFNLSKHSAMVLLDTEKAYDTGTKTVYYGMDHQGL